MKERTRNLLLILTDLLLCVMCIGSFLAMALARDADGRLTDTGLKSLKYFTVDSNILCGLAALTEAVSVAGVCFGRQKDVSGAVKWLRLAGTSGVAMTLFVVMVFLGPTMGYRYMFVGASLYMHLLAPVIAVLSYLFFTLGRGIARRRFYLASIPLAIYAVFYIIGVIAAGRVRDWYGFAAWGNRWLAPVFILVILASCGISYLLARFGGAEKAHS